MKRQSMLGLLSVVITVLAVVAGCGSDEKRASQLVEKFGPSMDSVRTNLGILPIPANAGCSFAGMKECSVSWMNGDADACHMSKRLVFDKGISVPISETDQVRCPEGMMTIETTYSANGSSVDKQVFKVKGKEMPADKAKVILKQVMDKDAARVIPPPSVEEAARNK